jgi:hypothetical protein
LNWSTRDDLRAQVQRLWDKGDLLRALIPGAVWEPRRLRLRGPSSIELSEHFDAVRTWLDDFRRIPRVRIVWREFFHRVLGACTLPDEVWLDSPQDGLAMIGKLKESRRFDDVLQATLAFDEALFDDLRPWLSKQPLAALSLADDWLRLLYVVAWVQTHPHPGIYLRQIDLPGIDSKFIESQRAVLSELLNLVLPPAAIDNTANGLSQFCRRYGFKDKPLRIRLRVLDTALSLPGLGAEQDITLTQADFAHLALPVQRVFITENEINFLAFPAVRDSVVIFGAGYGFEALAGARWLQRCAIHYWGDIDTHGFAILDQLRAYLPHAQSLLMDSATLQAHRTQWGSEPQPVLRDLPRLSAEETLVFNDLRDNRLQPLLRLEQERIGFGWLQQALTVVAVKEGAERAGREGASVKRSR